MDNHVDIYVMIKNRYADGYLERITMDIPMVIHLV
jgi:hypothetical protein